MAKYWFKPKWFGFGFYPITIEGWLSTLFLVFLILLSAFENHIIVEPGPDRSECIRFFLDAIILSGVATLFFEKKMKEPLGWRWGKK